MMFMPRPHLRMNNIFPLLFRRSHVATLSFSLFWSQMYFYVRNHHFAPPTRKEAAVHLWDCANYFDVSINHRITRFFALRIFLVNVLLKEKGTSLHMHNERDCDPTNSSYLQGKWVQDKFHRWLSVPYRESSLRSPKTLGRQDEESVLKTEQINRHLSELQDRQEPVVTYEWYERKIRLHTQFIAKNSWTIITVLRVIGVIQARKWKQIAYVCWQKDNKLHFSNTISISLLLKYFSS